MLTLLLAAALTLSANGLALNPAQQSVVTVTGATPPLQAVLDRRLVQVAVDPSGASVTVTATQATGEDVLHLTDAAGNSADLPIRVAFNAGTIVPETTLTVTGSPAQPDWLAEQVHRLVERLTQSLPGAQATVAAVTPPPAPLAPGGTAQFVVPVQIAGNGRYFDRSGNTTVTVQNASLQPFSPALLFYDDDPEHVAQDGVLFRGTVTAAQPARLYYYHDDAQDPRSLVVALRGSPGDPAQVQLVDAAAGPNEDVMQVGQSLSKRFLLDKANGEGIVVDLPQDGPYLLSNVPLNSGQLVAGTVDLRVLSGGPVQVTVLAVSPGIDPNALLDGAVLAGDGHHRTGVFQIATLGNDALNYSVGGAESELVIGDTDPTPANVDPSSPNHDYGDYGVVHSIALTLQNPSPAPATAYLYMQPLAGPARGAFLVNGTPVEVGCVRARTRYQVSAFDLAPSQTVRATVQTMTDGGSFYPIRLGLSATPPQASAPAIDAPDGCFPKPAPAATP